MTRTSTCFGFALAVALSSAALAGVPQTRLVPAQPMPGGDPNACAWIVVPFVVAPGQAYLADAAAADARLVHLTRGPLAILSMTPLSRDANAKPAALSSGLIQFGACGPLQLDSGAVGAASVGDTILAGVARNDSGEILQVWVEDYDRGVVEPLTLFAGESLYVGDDFATHDPATVVPGNFYASGTHEWLCACLCDATRITYPCQSCDGTHATCAGGNASACLLRGSEIEHRTALCHEVLEPKDAH